MTDAELANKLGVSASLVYRQRTKRGIVAFRDSDLVSEGTKERKKRRKPIDWDDVELGRKPDFVVAKKLGCAASLVGQARARRGIPLSFEAEQMLREYQRASSRLGWRKK